MEQKTTISLANTPQVDPNKIYMVDWSRMTSVNDMVLILASMGIALPGNHPNIEMIKHLLNLDQPVGEVPQPEKKELKLPKLKTINGQG